MKKKTSSLQIKTIRVCAILVVLFASATAHAQSLGNNTLTNLTFEQRLDAQVSRELQFRDEHGRTVTLPDLSNRKPVILMLGYYECPMLCDLALNGLVESIQNLRWSIGTEFDVINVSIDARETPALALAKKRSYVRRYGREGAENGWHFLTGDEAAIQQLAREIGFQYAYDSAVDEFAHPAGFVVLTPDGKVARYFFGVQYPPAEVLSALKSAAENKISSPIQQLVYLCFRYNPIGGKYGALIMLALRIGGVGTLAGVVWLVIGANRTRRRRLAELTLNNSGSSMSVIGELPEEQTSPRLALTPALSPKERENPPPPQRKPKTELAEGIPENSTSTPTQFPLPGGEGQGEGESPHCPPFSHPRPTSRIHSSSRQSDSAS